MGGDGTFWQLISSVYYTDPISSGCAGTAYVGHGDPKVISRYGNKFYVRAGTPQPIAPKSYSPAGSPTGTCLSYPPAPISPITSTATNVMTVPVSALEEVSAPTVVPPVTIN